MFRLLVSCRLHDGAVIGNLPDDGRKAAGSGRDAHQCAGRGLSPNGVVLAAVAYYIKSSNILPREALLAVFDRLREDERKKYVTALLRVVVYKTNESS